MLSPWKAHRPVQNPVSLYAAGYGLSPRRCSIHEPDRLWTAVRRTRSGNRSALIDYVTAHNCGYRDYLRHGACDTGDQPALACQLLDQFMHV